MWNFSRGYLRQPLVLVVAMAGTLALGAGAALASDHDGYALVITPSSVTGGTSTAFNFALTNNAGNDSALGAADFTAPPGFTVTKASLPLLTMGSAKVSGDTVQVRGLSLAAGKTLNVTVTATSPSSGCGSTTYTWSSSAWQGANAGGQALALTNAGAAQTTTVSNQCATAVKWGTEPADADVGKTITGSSQNPSGPALTVDIVDQNGQVVTNSSAPVTVALGSNPTGATLSGTTTKNAVNGVATFNNLSIDKAGYGYTLVASSAGLPSATSSSFNEYDTGQSTVCQENVNCSATSSDSTTQGSQSSQKLSVTATFDPANPDAGLLTTALDHGISYWTAHQAQCGGMTFIGQDTDVVDMTASTRGKTLTDTVTTALPNLAAFPLLLAAQSYCMAAPYPFVGASGQATATTMPDGNPGFIAQLATCAAQPSQPCISSSTGFLAGLFGTFTVKVQIPAGEPGDPQGVH